MTATPIFTCTPDGTAAQWSQPEDGLPTIVVSARIMKSPQMQRVWPAIQPGIFDADGGYRAHRIVVEFDIDPHVEMGPAHSSAALLTLEFSSERGPCPDLEISLDDTHRGLFHPNVVRADRSETGEPGPVAGPVRLQVGFPAEWLPPGRHTLAVTTALDPAAALGEHRGDVTHDIGYLPTEQLPAAREHYGHWFGSYLRWSRAELVATTDVPSAAEVVVRPTPLFVRHGDAEVELVDIDLTWPAGSTPPSRVAVQWPAARTEIPPVPAGRDFGMFRMRIPAPELDAPTTVTIDDGTATRREHLTPCRRWTLHLIPHVHLDLGFTDAQGKVLELHCRNIDRALDHFDRDPDFRFCVDGSMVVQEYFRTRSTRQQHRLRAAVERGVLAVNGFHSNLLTGVTSLAELFAATDFALGLPSSAATGLRYANLTDVPTSSRTIPSVLAQRGIDGFVGMSNHGRAATPTSDELHLISPVRWEGPDGATVLAHFADHYSQLRFIAGDPQALAGGADGLLRYLHRYERPDYLPDDLAVIGTHADNEDLADGDIDFVGRWNATFSSPRFRVSTFDEYLAAVAPLREQLPRWNRETGSFWEDGFGAVALEFVSYRTTQALLPAVEMLAAAVAVREPRYQANRHELDRGWSDLSVAAEHTFTWSRATSHPHGFPVADQLGWKTRFVEDARRVTIDETRRQLAQVAEMLDAVGPGLLTYNPHPWPADLQAEVDLAEGSELTGKDGAPVEVETLSSCSGLRHCRLALPAMPANGYRFLPMTAVEETVPGGDTEPDLTPEQSREPEQPEYVGADDLGAPIRTESWSLELDPITSLPVSLRHRHSGRELLDHDSGVRLGQLIRVATAPFPQPNSMTEFAEVHPHRRARSLHVENYGMPGEPDELLVETVDYRFAGVKSTFDGARLRWTGDGPGLSEVTLDLLLRHDSDRCDVDVSFSKEPCLDMEAVYLAFPFAGLDPVWRYDRQLGWVEPGTDHGPGSSNEWVALTNTVAVHTPGGGVLWTSLDAPLFTAGDVFRGRWPEHFAVASGHLFSYVMNNYWPCNTPPAQHGRLRLRYRFSPAGEFDPAAASRFGRIARLDAQLAEILPLDRFSPSTAPSFAEDRLIDVGADENTDVTLRQLDETTMQLQLVNLAADARTTQVRLPVGFRPADADGPIGPDVATFDLPRYGVARRLLVREQIQDDVDGSVIP